MDCLLDKCLEVHKDEIIMAKKFVDDLFLIVKTTEIPNILETFNRQKHLNLHQRERLMENWPILTYS
jgi:hypothetical protein